MNNRAYFCLIAALTIFVSNVVAAKDLSIGRYMKDIPYGYFEDEDRIRIAEESFITVTRALHERGIRVHLPNRVINRVDREAAAKFGINPFILAAIIRHESGKTCMVKKNEDGTSDLGRAQINTVHGDRLYREFGIKMIDVACDDRLNSLVGAWHYSNKLKEGKGHPWVGVGRYHNKQSEFAVPYIKLVREKYLHILNEAISVSEKYLDVETVAKL